MNIKQAQYIQKAFAEFRGKSNRLRVASTNDEWGCKVKRLELSLVDKSFGFMASLRLP